MRESIPWVFFVSEMGRPLAERELQKLKLDEGESLRVRRTMRRGSIGQIMHGDISYLGRDLWELRVRLPHRIVRFIYFIQSAPVAHVVVLIAVKKTQKTPQRWLDTAISRRDSWFTTQSD